MKIAILNFKFLGLICTFLMIFQSCDKNEEPAIVNEGNITFYVGGKGGYTKEPIAITVYNSNQELVAEGEISIFSSLSPTMCDIYNTEEYFTVDLPKGEYKVFIIEGNSETVEGAWFTDVEGADLSFGSDFCSNISIGESVDWLARPNPNLED